MDTCGNRYRCVRKNADTQIGYVRFMGIRDLASFVRISRARTSELETWASLITTLAAKEVFVYVDNYFEGHAPATANKLKEILSLPAVDPERLEAQASLF